MKKLVTILVVLMSLGLSLGGCKKEEKKPKVPVTTELEKKADETAKEAGKVAEEAVEEAKEAVEEEVEE
ncbi:MAG: hypothetical protein JXD22_01795 [Sedimentisphaerales bacterium]|nr:hypothetical protein [Sedimentisphaerales bacterium]